jgi:hypothetical protein
MNVLERGDKVRTPSRIPGVWHYGVYLGFVNSIPVVIHNSKVERRVVVSPYDQFSGGQPVYLVKRPAAELVDALVEAALSLEGTQYDLLNFNCETFANLVHEGTPTSPQVTGWMTVATSLVGIGVLSRYASGSTYDPDVGRYRDRNGRFRRR